MPSPEQVVARYHAGLLDTASRTGLAVGVLWDQRAGVDERSAASFAVAAARLVAASQSRTVALVDAYVTALHAAIGRRGRPAGLDTTQVLAGVRNGADPVEVYLRAIVTARTVLSRGNSVSDAMRAGRARAVSAAETDVMLAQRHTVAADRRVRFYRRTLTGQSCALCATASTQRYRTGDLMPIHNHCDCGVAPIIGDVDPGHVINRQLLRDLKAQGGSQYWKDRGIVVDEDGTVRKREVVVEDGERREVPGEPLAVEVEEHGELGPVLVDASHRFTGPAALAA